MSTSSGHLTISGLDVEVFSKDIKNLHIGVYPPLGRVRVAAPNKFDDEKVRLAVIRKLPWINRQRALLQAAQRQSQREMVTGESHYVWGVRHRLKVVERTGRANVELVGNRLLFCIPEGTNSDRRRKLLEEWYRQQLREAIPDLMAKWTLVLGVSVPRFTVRRMRTKWGSYNRERHHILFNTELAKKHPDCLEYIVVHEITHQLERAHSDRFASLMDRLLPDWRRRRDCLNQAPLPEEEWTCL